MKVSTLSIRGVVNIQSLDLHLTPLHALVGPEQSGKSRILNHAREQHRITTVTYPEYAKHPADIAAVVKKLRDRTEQGEQILIKTYSPLVLNEMLPSEVTIITRIDGVIAGTRMCDTPHFEERFKVYNLGELWLSYANGIDEAPLLKGLPRELPPWAEDKSATICPSCHRPHWPHPED